MEKYEKLELEVIELNGENVIVTSCQSPSGGDDGWSEWT